ncbi:MAG: transketolase C-terminal domain-containing protein [Planctomycetota bacterium]|jgi:2-oxoglutarate ferredoxin oxidoreductase subunit alpha
MAAFIDGNEAVVRGAMDAGCDFFAGYPITPASSILTGMLRALPPAGGTAVQAEDEIASMGFCIGAVMAGRRALTATSGPGLSLYSENVGLAVMGETPLVIVDVQRQGPATGSATMGAQGDVQFARWITSGGYPTITLAPTTATECYLLTREAFALSERYRTPVFLLTDKELGLTRERVDFDALPPAPEIVRRAADPDASFLPHGFDAPEDVSPMAPYGGPHILRYTTSMHDRTGYLTKDRETIQAMMEHLETKILAHVDDFARVDVDGDGGTPIALLSYGSSARSALEAARRARRRGGKIRVISVKSLWPVPEEQILRAARGAETIVVVEQNLGEYVREIRRILPSRDVRLARRMDGRLVPPDLILETAGMIHE